MKMAAHARSTLRLFVGNLPWTVSRYELREYFQMFGPVKQASVLFNKETGMSRGYGFVQFGSREAYTAAISQNEHVLDNYKILIAASGKGASTNASQGKPKDD
ncbi:SRA stem-loop-interacting RNA-binding protein, mitochondrial-like [Liolophura sinensis]|uniref:SRA stem-loop-interacting RNA-binding protein, mitochondrial-like n=1 Tax=Liolophura sinensis TaxID=3198878 RepID=UPI0031598977